MKQFIVGGSDDEEGRERGGFGGRGRGRGGGDRGNNRGKFGGF